MIVSCAKILAGAGLKGQEYSDLIATNTWKSRT